MDDLPPIFPRGQVEDDNQATDMVPANILHDPARPPTLLDPSCGESYPRGVVHQDDTVIPCRTIWHLSSTDLIAPCLLSQTSEEQQVPDTNGLQPQAVSTYADGLDSSVDLDSMLEPGKALPFQKRKLPLDQLLPPSCPPFIQDTQHTLITALLQQNQQLQQIIAQQQNHIQQLEQHYRRQQQQQEIRRVQPMTVHPFLQQQALSQQLNPMGHVVQRPRIGQVT